MPISPKAHGKSSPPASTHGHLPEEGLLVGYSSGAAMQAVFKMRRQLKPTDVVVVLFPDHGSRYLGKIYNDDWMRQQGFIREPEQPSPYAQYIRKIYRTYRLKYRRYLRQTRETFRI